jgi:hypothetical protein
LTDLTHLKGNAPYAFAVAERHGLDGLRLSFFSPTKNDQVLTRDLLTLLGEIGSEQCVPFFVETLTWTSTNDHAANGRLLLSTLIQVGRPAIEALLQRAIADDDKDVHRMLAALLVAHYGVRGAREWIAAVVVQNALDDAQLKRLQLVSETIGTER